MLINSENKYLYIWIDILGFGDFVKKGNTTTYNKMIDLVDSFRDKFSNIKLTPEVLIPISDGMVIVFKLENIELIFETIAKAQLEFILEMQEFLRGGFAVGTIANEKYIKIEENPTSDKDNKKQTIFLVSNGLIDAYNIESNLINYPIIGTTIETIKNIDSNISYFNLKKINGKNGGLLYVVDFLEHLQQDAEKEKFKKIICNKIKEFSHNEKVLQKYIWLLKYYEVKFSENGELCNKYLKDILL